MYVIKIRWSTFVKVGYPLPEGVEVCYNIKQLLLPLQEDLLFESRWVFEIFDELPCDDSDSEFVRYVDVEALESSGEYNEHPQSTTEA